MYIEFDLEYNNLYTESLLARSLSEWSQKYNVKYRSKHHKLKFRLTFDDDNMYTFFCLTWTEEFPWAKYRIVRDLNNRI